jgi:hypothetical protein
MRALSVAVRAFAIVLKHDPVREFPRVLARPSAADMTHVMRRAPRAPARDETTT